LDRLTLRHAPFYAPVNAIIASTIRLDCRKVVLGTLYCIGCKSAKMSAIAFLRSIMVLAYFYAAMKSSAFTIFGEGIAGWEYSQHD
jgi:hypothetical protein